MSNSDSQSAPRVTFVTSVVTHLSFVRSDLYTIVTRRNSMSSSIVRTVHTHYLYQSISISIFLSICRLINPSIQPSIHPSIHLSTYSSIYLPFYVFLSVCLSKLVLIHLFKFNHELIPLQIIIGMNSVFSFHCSLAHFISGWYKTY